MHQLTRESDAHTILIVDDDPASSYLKSRWLNRLGYRVIEPPTAPTRSPSPLSNGPLSSYLMSILPDINGSEVCERLKTTSPTKHIKVPADLRPSQECVGSSEGCGSWRRCLSASNRWKKKSSPPPCGCCLSWPSKSRTISSSSRNCPVPSASYWTRPKRLTAGSGIGTFLPAHSNGLASMSSWQDIARWLQRQDSSLPRRPASGRSGSGVAEASRRDGSV